MYFCIFGLLCYSVKRKDGSNQVTQMIKYTATPTNVRKDKIMQLLHYFDHNANPVTRAFGLHLGTNFVKVHMRLLPPPLIEYYQGKTIYVCKGAWRPDNVSFLKPCIKSGGQYRFAIAFLKGTTDFNLLEMLKQSVR